MSRRKQKRGAWLDHACRDSFNRRARQQGYRSRSVFKLLEIDHRDRLIKSGMHVLELGAAPGGWTQYVAENVGPTGTVVAIDLLPMEPLNNVRVLRGNFADPDFQLDYISALDGPVDLVLSDMAPNITGIRQVDQANVLTLLEQTLHLSTCVLRQGGNLLMKVFEGPELKDFRAKCDRMFGQVQVRKPVASRSRSREYYLLAQSLLHTTPRIR